MSLLVYVRRLDKHTDSTLRMQKFNTHLTSIKWMHGERQYLAFQVARIRNDIIQINAFASIKFCNRMTKFTTCQAALDLAKASKSYVSPCKGIVAVYRLNFRLRRRRPFPVLCLFNHFPKSYYPIDSKLRGIESKREIE